MSVKLETCPKPDKLVDYLLGKLPEPESESCELHIADCKPCVETIHSLNVHDTLDELTREVLQSPPDLLRVQEPESNDENIVSELINKVRTLGTAIPNSASADNGSSDVAATPTCEDRASEVQRWFDPSDGAHEIGKLGQYRIQKLLGAGSTGVVYQALDETLDRPVALKILRPSLGQPARERFMAEARAAAAIDHPNVITIYQVGHHGPLAFIAMQWLPGDTLEYRLAIQTTLSTDLVKSIGGQIASGLAAAHAQGLIHRDIKPANIWLDSQNDQVKILDFGLVRITDEDPQLTCTGMIAGTPCFMSPEQSRGAELDHRSDLFGLGCLLYQSLTGQLPFRSSNALATLQSIQRDEPLNPHEYDPSIPVELSDLVMCLLEKSPERRPPSATAVADALSSTRSDWSFNTDHLSNSSAGQNPVSKSIKMKSRRRPKPGRLPLPFFIATTVVLLMICGYFAGPQIIRIATNQGQIVIDSNDPNVKIEILQGGARVRVVDLKTEQQIDINAGDYEIRPVSNDNTILLSKNKVTLKRGGRQIVSITQIDRDTGVGQPFGQPGGDPYTLDTNDVLGIYIEGVLGQVDENPPVHFPPPESGLPPSTGFPVVIRSDGTLSLPLVEPVKVRGLTVAQTEDEVRRVYVKDHILQNPRIIVSLMRPRNYRPPAGRVDWPQSSESPPALDKD